MAAGRAQVALLLLGALFAGAAGGATFDDALSMPASRSTAHGAQEGHAGPEAHAHQEHAAHDHSGDPLALRDFHPERPPDLTRNPPFPLESGTRPSLSDAQSFARRVSNLQVKGDAGLDKLRAEGLLKGAGTSDDPYVLERFYVEGSLAIQNAARALILREGYVGGQLRLNYVGEELYVHHVYAADLRVNENIKRDGANTGGLFHDNAFGFVGQLRHFVGEFRSNSVGPRPANAILTFLGDTGVLTIPPGVAFNFDGFHAASVHHNAIIGQVDIKLHGHNHGDCFTCPVHDHADPAQYPGGNQTHEIPGSPYGFRTHHSIRYASLDFHHNTITVPSGVALRYYDRNHAGDDRTANSEPNEHLKDPHWHVQDVTLRDNRLVGGQLFVDVFNAADPHHPLQNRGILRLLRNDVTVRYDAGDMNTPAVVSGLRLLTADGIELRLEENRVRFEDTSGSRPTSTVLAIVRAQPELRGIQMDVFDAGNLTLARNIVELGRLGAFAAKFTADVRWRLEANDFRTTEAWRGKDVANPPEER